MAGFELRDLSASFAGKRVIGPLSLTVWEGEKVALVGKSGAGKSTLVNLIHQQLDQQTSLVPQELGLVNALPVFHNVFMGQLDQHPAWYATLTLIRPFARDREAIRSLLADLDMAEKLWTPSMSLSGGQRQRVAIARAIWRNSSILLADEPVSALDGPMAHRVMQLLVARFGTSVIALHDVELALRYCNRIVGIQEGHVALDEPSERLQASDIMTLY
jgi:phosphonate transport system ATP-binding protein